MAAEAIATKKHLIFLEGWDKPRDLQEHRTQGADDINNLVWKSRGGLTRDSG